ncbi:MAG: hypothetical protein R3268_07435 [Acidiferrobacterales bacterium]|nr:hypothetical protein [Acidiferrobacterales bacterium]
MSNDPVKLVTPERVKELLDCYGSSPYAWPESERAAALALLDGSSELQAHRDAAHLLDEALNLQARGPSAVSEQTAVLAKRILDQLEAQDRPSAQSLDDRVPLFDRFWIWPTVALAGLATIALVMLLWSIPPITAPRYRVVVAANDFDNWVWAEVLDDAPPDPRWDNDLSLLLEPGLVPDDS